MTMHGEYLGELDDGHGTWWTVFAGTREADALPLTLVAEHDFRITTRVTFHAVDGECINQGPRPLSEFCLLRLRDLVWRRTEDVLAAHDTPSCAVH